MNFIDALERASNPIILSTIFNVLATRGEEEQQYVIDQVIDNMLPDLELIIYMMQLDGVEDLLEEFEQGTMDADETESMIESMITAPQMAEIIFNEIIRVKKDQAPDLAKSFTKEAAKMTPAEKTQPRAWINVARKVDL